MHSKISMLNSCFGRVLKRSLGLSVHLIQVKLFLFTFISMADCMPSERMANFWTVRFLKTELRFSAHPEYQYRISDK